MAARTVAEAITAARVLLNDRDANTANLRMGDADLTGFATDALNALRNKRPDLFIGSGWGELTAATNLPVDNQFFRPIVDYMAAMAELVNDEDAISGRANALAGLMTGFLK